MVRTLTRRPASCRGGRRDILSRRVVRNRRHDGSSGRHRETSDGLFTFSIPESFLHLPVCNYIQIVQSRVMSSQGPVYIGSQRQCYGVAGDSDLIKLFRFLNKPSKSLQKWGATSIDQILCKRGC